MTTKPLAIVTGADGNLGGAVVKRLTSDGFRVAQFERGHVVVDGKQITTLDLTDAASTRNAFALATAGAPLQALVHTVGTFRAGTALVDASDADFIELFRVNVMTTLHAVQAALAIMLPQNAGRIAVVASLDAVDAAPKRAAYGASKAAQLRMMESAAADVKGTPITLNTVLPSTMDTPQNRAAMPKADPAKWLKLEEVANVLAYLVSDAASGIHGQAIRVERG